MTHTVKAAYETWSNPRVKVNSTHAWFFQREPCCEKNVMSNVNFVLCTNNKDDLETCIIIEIRK